MILWKEYQRIKEQDGGWTEADVRILLNFCWELQVVQHDLSEELKKALDNADKLHNRVSFYRQLYPLRSVSNASS